MNERKKTREASENRQELTDKRKTFVTPNS